MAFVLGALSVTGLQGSNIGPPMCDHVVEILEGQQCGGGLPLSCLKTAHHAKGLCTPSLTESTSASRQYVENLCLVLWEHSAVMKEAEPQGILPPCGTERPGWALWAALSVWAELFPQRLRQNLAFRRWALAGLPAGVPNQADMSKPMG